MNGTIPRAVSTASGIGAAISDGAARLSGSSDSPRLDTEVLLAYALKKPRPWLIAHHDHVPGEDELRNFNALIEHRAQGKPVAYLTGSREFWSRRFRVTNDTLIPRPETEHLVEAALERLPVAGPCHVADLGTGSGIIGLTIALERPDCHVTATDFSTAALSVARDNAALFGAKNIKFRQADWFNGLEGETFGLIAANPPYVDDQDPHLLQGDLRFEPRLALAAERGLAALEAIISRASEHLLPGGWLVLEHGHDQGTAVAQLLEHHGYTDRQSISDLGGHPRIAAARHANHYG